MSISFNLECLQCYTRRNLQIVQPLGTEEQTMAFLKELMKLYVIAPEDISSSWFGPAVADLMQKMYGLSEDRHQEEKEISNRFVLERMDQIREKVTSAADPVLAGLQFAILGNYLDFTALQGQVSFEKLEGMLENALDMQLDMDCYAQLCQDMAQGKTLLYITDNAGEIGFDRIFAETIAEKYPHLQITFCVRGAMAANDATREDAAVAGIPFPVIDNGTCIAGTVPELISEQSRTALEQSDVVISKGQGNCETLYGSPYNIYFAFLVKCSRFIDKFNRPKFTPMLTK